MAGKEKEQNLSSSKRLISEENLSPFVESVMAKVPIFAKLKSEDRNLIGSTLEEFTRKAKEELARQPNHDPSSDEERGLIRRLDPVDEKGLSDLTRLSQFLQEKSKGKIPSSSILLVLRASCRTIIKMLAYGVQDQEEWEKVKRNFKFVRNPDLRHRLLWAREDYAAKEEPLPQTFSRRDSPAKVFEIELLSKQEICEKAEELFRPNLPSFVSASLWLGQLARFSQVLAWLEEDNRFSEEERVSLREEWRKVLSHQGFEVWFALQQDGFILIP